MASSVSVGRSGSGTSASCSGSKAHCIGYAPLDQALCSISHEDHSLRDCDVHSIKLARRTLIRHTRGPPCRLEKAASRYLFSPIAVGASHRSTRTCKAPTESTQGGSGYSRTMNNTARRFIAASCSLSGGWRPQTACSVDVSTTGLVPSVPIARQRSAAISLLATAAPCHFNLPIHQRSADWRSRVCRRGGCARHASSIHLTFWRTRALPHAHRHARSHTPVEVSESAPTDRTACRRASQRLTHSRQKTLASDQIALPHRPGSHPDTVAQAGASGF